MKFLSLLLLFLCLCSVRVHAQTGGVDGAIKDPSGSIVPKASVEYRNQETGIRRQTTSNGDGLYHIEGMDPGKYDVTVQAAGFKNFNP